MALNFPQLEERILRFWKQSRAFEKSVQRRPKSRSFVFYEGPPTANGMPGLHHVEARSFKDAVCRYKTMRGYYVERRAGWDTHGLPVEIQVEKELGLKNKKDIERYGIAKFNEKSRSSVWRYKAEWERLTERMGFWIDMSDPYVTYDPLYIETLWWVLAEAHKKKLLYEGHRVVPFCTRCGTSLSSHEVAQGYDEATTESVFVKFKVKNPKAHKLPPKTYLLAWTTTPWTLPGNVALAVGRAITYSVVAQEGAHYVVAQERLDALGGEYTIVRTMKGAELSGISYEPLSDALADTEGKKYVVLTGDFVTTEDGTGIVHTSVMYGEEDYELGLKHNLPRVHTVNEDGTFNKRVTKWAGKNIKNVEPLIVEDLKERGLLYKTFPYKHTYPFCWRCSTPLVYYARHSWFVKMSALRSRLIAANKKINWIPAYLKEGRFGEWLEELKDWAISRSRYWGTPMPIWRCSDCGRVQVLSSRADIAVATKGTNTYYIMRHGESQSNVRHVLAGGKNADKYGLTKVGETQAKRAAQKLKRAGIDVIISSPLRRTKETAGIIAQELGVRVVVDKRFIETQSGVLEGGSTKDFEKTYRSAPFDFTKEPPRGESIADISGRVRSAMDALEKKYQGKTILIVSHGDALWMLQSTMAGLVQREAAQGHRKLFLGTGEVRSISYAQFPYNKEGELDLHRPYVDDITFACSACTHGVMKRDEYVADVWFDSGAMPFAQAHYPFEHKRAVESGAAFPADYICEAIDQTRGWFYTLLAVAGFLGFAQKTPPFKNVITVGIVLDERGQKMSKSKGNIVDPNVLADTYGMDAVRWYFFTVNGPADAKRFTEREVAERMQRFVSTLWNVTIFLKTYASAVKPPARFASGNVLDVWMHARLKEVGREVAREMDAYHIVEAARALNDAVINDLSNWYVRRSRSRFQRPRDKNEHDEAAESLAFFLNEFAKLVAPLTPFLAEAVWQDVNDTKIKSVHWEDYPAFAALTVKERTALSAMQRVRTMAEAHLRLRADAHIRVRQPLSASAIPGPLPPAAYQSILKDELNVENVVPFDKMEHTTEKGWRVNDSAGALNITLSSSLKMHGYGRELVRAIQDMRRSLGLKPTDRIRVSYSLSPDSLRGKLTKFEETIANDTNADSVREKAAGKTRGAVRTVALDAQDTVTVAVDKA